MGFGEWVSQGRDAGASEAAPARRFTSTVTQVLSKRAKNVPLMPKPKLDRLVIAAQQARVFGALFAKEHASQPFTLGRYRVIDTLGEGGMGAVLRAFDRQLDREIALKVLHEESTSATLLGFAAKLRRWPSCRIPMWFRSMRSGR